MKIKRNRISFLIILILLSFQITFSDIRVGFLTINMERGTFKAEELDTLFSLFKYVSITKRIHGIIKSTLDFKSKSRQKI